MGGGVYNFKGTGAGKVCDKMSKNLEEMSQWAKQLPGEPSQEWRTKGSRRAQAQSVQGTGLPGCQSKGGPRNKVQIPRPTPKVFYYLDQTALSLRSPPKQPLPTPYFSTSTLQLDCAPPPPLPNPADSGRGRGRWAFFQTTMPWFPPLAPGRGAVLSSCWGGHGLHQHFLNVTVHSGHLGSCPHGGSDSVGLSWSLGVCISDKLPGMPLWVPRVHTEQ